MPKLFGRNFTRRQLLNRVGDISQLMYARRAERREGFERGADLIDVFNASGLGFSVLPGRALDIASALHRPPGTHLHRPAQRKARPGIVLAVQAQRDPHRQPMAALPQRHLRHRH